MRLSAALILVLVYFFFFCIFLPLSFSYMWEDKSECGGYRVRISVGLSVTVVRVKKR